MPKSIKLSLRLKPCPTWNNVDAESGNSKAPLKRRAPVYSEELRRVRGVLQRETKWRSDPVARRSERGNR